MGKLSSKLLATLRESGGTDEAPYVVVPAEVPYNFSAIPASTVSILPAEVQASREAMLNSGEFSSCVPRSQDLYAMTCSDVLKIRWVCLCVCARVFVYVCLYFNPANAARERLKGPLPNAEQVQAMHKQILAQVCAKRFALLAPLTWPAPDRV